MIYIRNKKPISFSNSLFLFNETKTNLTEKVVFNEPFLLLSESNFNININLFYCHF